MVQQLAAISISDCTVVQKDSVFNERVAEVLVQSMGTNVITIQKIPQFSFEKLLINLIHQLAKTRIIEPVVLYCKLVRDRLEPVVGGSGEEAESLLSCLSRVSCQSAVMFEQSGNSVDWEIIYQLKLLSLETSCIVYNTSNKDLSHSEVSFIIIIYISIIKIPLISH